MNDPDRRKPAHFDPSIFYRDDPEKLMQFIRALNARDQQRLAEGINRHRDRTEPAWVRWLFDCSETPEGQMVTMVAAQGLERWFAR